MPAIELTDTELWAIDEHCRQHQDSGRPWHRDFDRKVMAGLLAAEESATRKATVDFEEEELWIVHQQIPRLLMHGSTPTGKELHRKVAKALLALAEVPEDHDDDAPGTAAVPEVWAKACEPEDDLHAQFERWLESRQKGEG